MKRNLGGEEKDLVLDIWNQPSYTIGELLEHRNKNSFRC